MQTKFASFKAAAQEQGRFTGFAPYGTEFAPGAFSASLAESGGRVKILPKPDSLEPIGLATIREGTEGLHIDGKLELNLPGGRDAALRLAKQLVDGLSFEIGGPVTTRHGLISQAKLWSISLCVFPHQAAARITDVKRHGTGGDLRDLLSLLQDANLAIRTDRDRRAAADLQRRFKNLVSLTQNL